MADEQRGKISPEAQEMARQVAPLVDRLIANVFHLSAGLISFDVYEHEAAMIRADIRRITGGYG